MPRFVGAVLVVLMILLGLGLLIPYVYRQRGLSDRVVSQDHLRRISFAIAHSSLPGQPAPLNSDQIFPAGTVVTDLPAEQRLSWMVTLLNSLAQPDHPTTTKGKIKPQNPYQGLMAKLNVQEGWQSPANREAGQTRISAFLCPSNVPTIPEGELSPTQYIGIAGIGRDVAKLNFADAGKNAGVFRYDSITPLASIIDGSSNTMAFAETNFEIGPWIAGGPSTIRGIDPELAPFIGPGRQIGGLQLGGANVGMADGSVRFLNAKIHPRLFLALCTIAGQESKFEE